MRFDLFLATAAILARQWFLYFVVGYHFAYALLLIAGCVRLAMKGGFRRPCSNQNLVLFDLASVVAMVILLWPMVSHILAYNYAGRYSYYNGGGLALEAFYHIGRMGLFNHPHGAGSRLCGEAQSALPALSGPGCRLVVSILLFTRVQNYQLRISFCSSCRDIFSFSGYRYRRVGRGHHAPPEPQAGAAGPSC